MKSDLANKRNFMFQGGNGAAKTVVESSDGP